MLRSFPAPFLLLLLIPISATLAQVKVESHPPSVKTRTFDPKKPPAEMPPLKPGEAAVCESKFACGVQVEVEVTQPATGKPTAKVTGVNADLKLTVIIWLPSEENRKIPDLDKIRAHEEGHRKISEIFFDRGEAVAKELAQKYLGKSLDIAGAEATHTKPVIERVAHEFCQEYLGAIEVPSQKAQEKYDRITDHGRNEVSEKSAIEEALKKSEAVKQ